MPASEIRALALTRVRERGTRRGTAAARVTPYALDAMSTPSAAGKSQVESVITAVASTQHRKPRIAMVAPMAQRRPWLKRSRNGPISGATTANGSIVRPRKSATWPRASPVGTWKKSVPASEMATAASPAVLKACISINRESPESPAPSARAARRAWSTVYRPARPVTRAAPRTPRAVARAPVPRPRPTDRVRSPDPVAEPVPGPPGERSPGGGSDQRESPAGESGCGALMSPSCLLSATREDRDTGPT